MQQDAIWCLYIRHNGANNTRVEKFHSSVSLLLFICGSIIFFKMADQWPGLNERTCAIILLQRSVHELHNVHAELLSPLSFHQTSCHRSSLLSARAPLIRAAIKKELHTLQLFHFIVCGGGWGAGVVCTSCIDPIKNVYCSLVAPRQTWNLMCHRKAASELFGNRRAWIWKRPLLAIGGQGRIEGGEKIFKYVRWK